MIREKVQKFCSRDVRTRRWGPGDIRGICKIPAAHDPRQIVVQLIGEGPRLKLSISPLALYTLDIRNAERYAHLRAGLRGRGRRIRDSRHHSV